MRLHISKQTIYIFFMFEVTLLLFSIIVFNYQIRKRTKDSFSGKTTFTHGDPFKNSCHRIHRHIESSINIKAVQVDCLPSHSAWAKSSACFFILCQFIIWNNYLSQSLWSHHCILTLFLLFWGANFFAPNHHFLYVILILSFKLLLS